MTTPRRVAIIQARMSSSRFPGKVLQDLGGLPMIVFMVRRVQRARLLDQIVVATSTDTSDDPLVSALTAHRIASFRGNLNDVLDRFMMAARWAKADQLVRLTGDCPLLDADQIDRGLQELARGDVDYVCNSIPPSFPDGLDVECFTFAALETAWREARKPSQREHVTPYIREPDSGLRTRGWQGSLSLGHLRWTVDHADDLVHVRSIVGACQAFRHSADPTDFDRFDVLRALETQSLPPPGMHPRNEGYLKSLAQDAQSNVAHHQP